MTIGQNQPYSMEFQNFRRVHRNRVVGELFAIELEITEEDWHYLSAFPQDAIGQVAIQWSDRAGAAEKPKREPKPPKQATPYGAFWRELDARGFHNHPNVRLLTGYHLDNDDDAKTVLRRWLNVEKRSLHASPQMLIELLDGEGATDARVMVYRVAQSLGYEL